jgi:prophage regulatory protein
MDPVGTTDIAEILGVSRQRTQQIVNTKGFPDPVATVNSRTRMWDRAAVVAWVSENRYGIAPAPKP